MHMELHLTGKTALVTGGARGIGRAIAFRLLSAGADVCFTARSAGTIAAALEAFAPIAEKSGSKVRAKVSDVSNENAVGELYQFLDSEFGGIDILVNNAGVGVFRDLEQLSPSEWAQVIGTNLTGVYLMTHHALPRLKKRGGGWIVNISSLAGKNAFSGGAAYNASKFGLNGLSEAVMLDHRYDNIRVCSICPGSVDTEFGRGQGPASWKIAPEDVAEAVAMVLAMPERTLISYLEMRPSKPPRK